MCEAESVGFPETLSRQLQVQERMFSKAGCRVDTKKASLEPCSDQGASREEAAEPFLVVMSVLLLANPQVQLHTETLGRHM